MREAWARILEGHGFKLEYRRSRQIETYPHGEPFAECAAVIGRTKCARRAWP